MTKTTVGISGDLNTDALEAALEFQRRVTLHLGEHFADLLQFVFARIIREAGADGFRELAELAVRIVSGLDNIQSTPQP